MPCCDNCCDSRGYDQEKQNADQSLAPPGDKLPLVGPAESIAEVIAIVSVTVFLAGRRGSLLRDPFNDASQLFAYGKSNSPASPSSS